MMNEKSCTECGLIKDFISFDIDNKNLTGCTAKCKECRGTLIVKPKRKANKTLVKVEEDSSLLLAEELTEIKE